MFNRFSDQARSKYNKKVAGKSPLAGYERGADGERRTAVQPAIAKFIDDNGGRSFFDYSVPQAVISLKQGIGRLIRRSTDRGVIAILDPRLRTKSYGRDFLASLPRMRITSDLNDVRQIFQQYDDRAV